MPRLCSVLAGMALCVAAAGATGDTQPVADLLGRVVGRATAAIFDLNLDRTMKQGFTLSTTGSPPDVKVSVTASALPELAYGAGYYLRTYGLMQFSWERAGGNQIRVPVGGFPAVPLPVTRSKKVKWSYYQNVCTQSYSMWWWSWDRWQREIDWAALWGVNLMLAYTGQEHVFREVFNAIGVNDSVLNTTFDGPAFLTWSRGQGQFGFGAPLPNYWIESQRDLQVKIMNRLRELGIHGILAGFQGNVPKQMPEIFPHANTQNGWLDGMDPLFDKIGREIAAGQQNEFGPAEFIEADGWFELQTGPWYSSDMATGTGSAGGMGDGSKTVIDVSATLDDALGMAFVGDGSPSTDAAQATLDDGSGCLGGFRIPTEQEAFARATNVFSSLVSANPNATWIYQGYPWFRVHSQGASCNQTRLRHFIKGFVDAIPKDRLLVLDLIADSPGRALWRYPDDPVLGRFARNATLIWCALSNWGGAVYLGGDIEYVLNDTRAAMATDLVDGVGLTPEGIDTSPAYFSLVLDSAWTTEPTAVGWLQRWGDSRCGQKGVALVERAYALLAESVYRPGIPYLFCCSQPVYCQTVTPDQRPARPAYNVTVLRAALEAMVAAAPVCDSDSFNYDLVDVAREWLSMDVCLEKFDAVDSKAPVADLKAQVAALLEVYHDTDAIMGTTSGFLLGDWLKKSRQVSDWDGSDGTLANFYEWNSRVQISSWAGGYSRREWSGMIDGYYAPRLKIWLDYTLDQAEASAVPERKHDHAATVATITRGLDDRYTPVEGMDCNFHDIPNSKCVGMNSCSVAELEQICNANHACIGFNSPGCHFKSSCAGWEKTKLKGSVFYFKPGHTPPALPTSSCIGGFCRINAVNRTFNGTMCDAQCPPKPHPVPLPTQLDRFVARWQNETWTEEAYPSLPAGDPIALVKQLLAKYPATKASLGDRV